MATNERVDDLLYLINMTDYAHANLNQLRNDLTTLIQELRSEFDSMMSDHIASYHASEV